MMKHVSNFLAQLLRAFVLLALAFLLLPAFSGSAQGTQGDAKVVVRGRVLDTDGVPVAGAAVQNLAEKTFAVTDGNGEYQIAVKERRRPHGDHSSPLHLQPRLRNGQ